MTQSYELAQTNQQLEHIPGDYGWPGIGKTIALFRNPAALFDTHYRQYGAVSRISVTGQKMVMLVGPDLVKMLMLDTERVFSAKMGWGLFMSDFFAGGVLMKDFDEHRIHRRIMQNAFKSDAMRVYAEKIQVIVQHTVNQWRQQDEVIFFEEIKGLLLHIAFEVFCCVEQSREEEKKVNQAFIDMMEGTMGIIRKDIPGLLYHRGMNGRRFLKKYFMGLVAKKRCGNDTDILSHFCREQKENGDYFSDAEVAEHMIFLMLAAHDTTSSAVTMGAYHLAKDEKLQQQLRAEFLHAGKVKPYYEAWMSDMPIMQASFNEVIRLYPPVSIFFRRTVRDCNINGIPVPAHTMLMAPTIYNQRLQGWWKEPNSFLPQRFLPPQLEHKQHPFLWTPFGGGAHKCIGMHFAELLFKITFAELLRNNRITFAKAGTANGKLQYYPFAKPADDLPLNMLTIK
jgi:cytochrome P450